MPSGEIHYASNAPATRFKTSAAPSDARRVRHWLAVARAERHASLAASAGGQARNMQPPAYIKPASLKPINASNTIELVEVGPCVLVAPTSEQADAEATNQTVGILDTTQLYLMLRSGYTNGGMVKDKVKEYYAWAKKNGLVTKDMEKTSIEYTQKNVLQFLYEKTEIPLFQALKLKLESENNIPKGAGWGQLLKHSVLTYFTSSGAGMALQFGTFALDKYGKDVAKFAWDYFTK